MENPDLKSGQKETPLPLKQEILAVPKGLLPHLKTDRTLWFIVVFGVCGFFLAAALFAFFSGSKKTPKFPNPQPVAAVVPAPAAATPVVVVEAPKPQASPEGSTTPSAVPTLSLSGILYSDAESLALINGRVVPEGGTVDGAKVEKISSDEVELSFEGQKIVLRSR